MAKSKHETTVYDGNGPHPFSHLGPAPYRFIEVQTMRLPTTGQPSGSCQHCNTGIAYAFHFEASNGTRFYVGCDCALKADPGTAAIAQSWRRKHEAELRKLRAEKARAKREARWALENHLKAKAFVKSNPRGLQLLRALRTPHPICTDMRERLQRWGTLSEKQIDFALKLQAEAIKNASNPMPTEKSVPIPENMPKRVPIKGEIVSAKYKETPYGAAVKLVIVWEHDAGTSRIYGTAPKSVIDAYNASDDEIDALKGKRIALNASVKRSRGDVSFGFYSRPTQGRILERD
jgi:hypothetical protein